MQLLERLCVMWLWSFQAYDRTRYVRSLAQSPKHDERVRPKFLEMAATQSDTPAPSAALLAEVPGAVMPSDDASLLPLRGNVIHYTRTRNRFKIVPEGKMPHEAVFLPLMKMNSQSEGGCAVDDKVMLTQSI